MQSCFKHLETYRRESLSEAVIQVLKPLGGYEAGGACRCRYDRFNEVPRKHSADGSESRWKQHYRCRGSHAGQSVTRSDLPHAALGAVFRWNRHHTVCVRGRSDWVAGAGALGGVHRGRGPLLVRSGDRTTNCVSGNDTLIGNWKQSTYSIQFSRPTERLTDSRLLFSSAKLSYPIPVTNPLLYIEDRKCIHHWISTPVRYRWFPGWSNFVRIETQLLLIIDSVLC